MIRRGLLSLAVILGGILSSGVVHAAMVTTWDFTGGKPVEGWQIQGLDVRQGPDGLHIRGVGVMMHSVDATHRIDTISMIFARSVAGPSVLAWHRTNTPPNEFVQMPVALDTGSPYTVEIPLHTIPEWDPWSDVIGFKFETNDELVLSGIDLKGWTTAEKLGAAWQSFWKTDRILAFSINFLWGPLIAFTPPEVDGLYNTQPPMAWSAHRVSLAILLIAAILCAFWVLLRKWNRNPIPTRWAITAFFTVFAVLWGIHDIRMGYEFTKNAMDDLRSYSFAVPGKKSFRNLLGFHDGLFQNMDVLTKEKHYVIFAPDQSPMRKMAAYHTYPLSSPLSSDDPTLDAKVFYVFYDDKISINDKHELVRDGVVVSKPGHIAKQLNDRSYIFLVP
jgi:hypothetical protein